MSTPAARLQSRHHLLGLLLLLASLGLVAIDIFWGFWDHDSGFYLNQSAMMAAGLKPFVDFITIYPPLFNGLNAIPVALGVHPWTLLWAVPLFWISANCLLTVAYLRRATRERWPAWSAWVGGIAFALYCIDSGGNHNTLEHGVVFFGLASLLAFEGYAGLRFLAVGALVACATLSKQVGVLLLIPFATQVRSWRQALQLSAGFIAPLVVCLAWLQFDVDAIARSFEALKGYVGDDEPASGPWLLLQKFVVVCLTDLGRAPWIFIQSAACWGLGMYGVLLLVRRREYRSAAWLAAWMLVGAMFYGARVKNNFPHYSINLWPPIVAVVGTCAAVVPSTVCRRLFQAATALSVAFLVVFSWRIHDMVGKPYFTRWEHGGNLFFLKRVAEEIRRDVSPQASITQLGMEESVILFMAGFLPRNKDWGPYHMVAELEGDGILFTDYGQSEAAQRKKEILARGYKLAKVWSSSQWGTIQLYWR
ncbi:hypothetical protein LZ009_09710 [Ramlibacter sp. XY19]|uniref:hypothetical protein n=1 Tax=Ramlibacter paludis TaxID=2908000 RepID=UPI0023D99224|nr:hypothetical protein [Ramlibacter paludis]MCG2593056.1 hypothetical protein [Ramlibacter paludis]